MENHYIQIENKERISISQVTDVDAFDEETLWANLEEGGVEITGVKLNVEKLDMQEGILVVSGKIISVQYTDKNKKEKTSIFKKFSRV